MQQILLSKLVQLDMFITCYRNNITYGLMEVTFVSVNSPVRFVTVRETNEELLGHIRNKRASKMSLICRQKNPIFNKSDIVVSPVKQNQTAGVTKIQIQKQM